MTDEGELPPFKYPFAFTKRTMYDGGYTRRLNINDLPVSKKMTGVYVRLLKGAIRELHWHVPAEWVYAIYGNARITVVDPHGRGFVEDVEQGDIWFVPGGYAHSVQGTGDDGRLFLGVFDSGDFGSSNNTPFNLLDWLNQVPESVLAKNFLVPESIFDKL